MRKYGTVSLIHELSTKNQKSNKELLIALGENDIAKILLDISKS